MKIEIELDVLQQILDALCYAHATNRYEGERQARAIASIRAALLAPVVEPVATFDDVFDAIDWDVWRVQSIRELVRMIHSKTAPPPPLVPLLTDEQIATVYYGATGQSLRTHDNNLVRKFARAIEQSVHQALQEKRTKLSEPTQKGWCTGCTPDNCQGCGGASEGYNGITKG